MLDDAIQEIKNDLGKTVFGVCTDNEAKMKNLRQLVSRKYPEILVYGCGAHYANLLEEDVNNSQVLKHVIEIQKYFRNVHKAHGMLKEKGGQGYIFSIFPRGREGGGVDVPKGKKCC